MQNACLIKYVGDACVVADAWFLDGEHAFSIGRYSDCDVIETNQYASRLHCVIWRSGGRWFVKDEGSLHGTVVLDAQDNIVFDSCSGSGRVCELKYGQRIVLAQSSTYWFCAMNDRPSGMFAT